MMVLVSPFFYQFWIGDKATIPFLMTLLVGIYVGVFCWCSLNGTLAVGIGKIKLITYFMVVGMLIHIPFSIMLSRYIGAYGVITSMILITLVFAIVYEIQIEKIMTGKASGIWLQ